MKKIISLILASSLILTLAGCAGSSNKMGKDKLEQIKEKGSISMATSPDFAPNEFYIIDDKGNKQIIGSDIQLGQAIADKIGVKLEIKATDFNGALLNVQSGEADMAITGLGYTKEREKVIQFSNGYSREDDDGFQGILMKKETAEKFKSLEDIKKAKLKIGAQQASIQAELASDLTDSDKIKLLGTIDVLAMSLNAGDIDAVVVSSSSAEPLKATFTDLIVLSKESFNLDPQGTYAQTYVGLPLGDEYKSLVEVINEVIKENTDNGNLEKWVAEAKSKMDFQVE